MPFITNAPITVNLLLRLENRYTFKHLTDTMKSGNKFHWWQHFFYKFPFLATFDEKKTLLMAFVSMSAVDTQISQRP